MFSADNQPGTNLITFTAVLNNKNMNENLWFLWQMADTKSQLQIVTSREK